MCLIVICFLAVVQRSVTGVTGGFSISFDLSQPGMALIKSLFTCSLLLSSAACNLAAGAAVSQSKCACYTLSPAPPSLGSANAATVGRFGVG